MRNSQGTTLLFLALAVVLFFFSLSLLPAAEHYCQFRGVAIVLLVLETVLLVLRSPLRPQSSTVALHVASLVFAILGIVFNAILLIAAKGKC
ncbi:MAG TPA: hypothetical protein VG498_02225 [Terriglobales bacterium]|nr:hypothetical protein [Terriglobales bacterium]